MTNNTVKQIIGGWTVTMEWPEGATQGGPYRLVIEPADPQNPAHGGLSSTILRDIDFRAAAADLRVAGGVVEPARETLSELRSLLASGITPLYLSKLAAIYLEQTASGPKPVERIAKQLGKSPGTIQGHLWQARKKGLLDGSPGRVGGTLTDKAKELLSR